MELLVQQALSPSLLSVLFHSLISPCVFSPFLQRPFPLVEPFLLPLFSLELVYPQQLYLRLETLENRMMAQESRHPRHAFAPEVSIVLVHECKQPAHQLTYSSCLERVLYSA